VGLFESILSTFQTTARVRGVVMGVQQSIKSMRHRVDGAPFVIVGANGKDDLLIGPFTYTSPPTIDSNDGKFFRFCSTLPKHSAALSCAIALDRLCDASCQSCARL
jgi:hypothetical protein